MRATTAVPSTVLAATVTATMAEAVRKYSTVRDRKKVLDYGTQNVSCNFLRQPSSVIFAFLARFAGVSLVADPRCNSSFA